MTNESTNDGIGQGGTPPTNATRGLVCAACEHSRLKVVYTRPAPGGRIVRRRECRRCGKRITTWERRIGQVQMRNESMADAANGTTSRGVTNTKE
jgi:hypothetical protein